jgi:hypothetical protein
MPDSLRKVIGLGIATSHERQKKGNYSILDEFQEIHEDSMLIHHGEMIAIILHELVLPTEVLEHVRTLGDLFRYNGTIFRSSSQEFRMALFKHKFCHGNRIVEKLVPFPDPDFVHGCSFRKPFFLTTSSFLSLKYWHTGKKNIKNKEIWLQEKLEHFVDTWATEFVQANWRSRLTSWLRELDNFFTKELSFGTSQVRRSCFTTMVVTKNY